ncbi:MAG TPA: orotidine-5'-phosphate decarboxylase, partial [candidate division Zixibacteria bacterium]|nr:orotidine-5'-phosphate decarboxylase [candidate division Zixibacteria bacterium]
MYQIQKLKSIQSKNNSMISLGLDLDAKRMPADYVGSTKKMFDYVNRVIDATSDKVCAYKPNIAFYERFGADGWSLLKQIVNRVPEDIPVIIDCKRGDIGNTASHYAAAMFEWLDADWVTLNPYMGYDSLRPFIEYKEKGVFILCLTSNTGSKDFQHLTSDGAPLYRHVAEKVKFWDKDHNCGLVVGATQPDELQEIRSVAADMPILIPGVGAQGGDLETAAFNGTSNFTKPALINVSRSVLYASQDLDFAQKAREELI